MLFKQDHRICYDTSRCTRCGTCLSVCPVDALSLFEGRDTFDITVNHDACVICQKCVRVCPAAELPERRTEEEDFLNLRRAVLAHALDETVRFEATSGGIARTLARAALETRSVDAVYCAVQKAGAPYAEGGFLTAPGEIDRISNSVYCVFPFNRNLRREVGGLRLARLLYIGTNCQIQGAERFFRGTGVELIKVAIICKQQKTRAYVRWGRRMMKQRADDPAPIRYRGHGWPGKLTSGDATYPNYFRPFVMELWRVPGCRFCPHLLGLGSDILLADPWKLIPHGGDNPGLTMTLVRTGSGLSLWQKAAPYLVEEQQLTPGEVQMSIDWNRYRKKQAKVLYFLGRETSLWRRMAYGIIEKQRRFYEWLLDSVPVPETVEKVLNLTLKK